jgi:hypothetical protein
MKGTWRALVGAVSFVLSIGSAYPSIENRHVINTIMQAAQDVGVDPLYMVALAEKESSLNPTAKAGTSSAAGLFQFIDQTWLEVMWSFGGNYDYGYLTASIAKKPDGTFEVPNEEKKRAIFELRRDPYVSAIMAAELLERDRVSISIKLGRDLVLREFYLVHFLGRSGAALLLANVEKNPSASAPSIFPLAAEANKSIFYDKPITKTVTQTVLVQCKKGKKPLRKEVSVKVKVRPHRSVQDVYTNLGDMILRRMVSWSQRGLQT